MEVNNRPLPLDISGSSLSSLPHRTVGAQMIVHADCLKALRSMPAHSVDVIVTSPPYNIGVKYAAYKDKLPREQYLAWLGEVFAELGRVLREDGSFFLNVGNTNKDPWIEADVSSVARAHFTLQNHIVWVKSISIGDDTVGHFKPISSKRYLNNNHEAVFHFTPRGSTLLDRVAIGVPFKDKSNIARFGHQRDRRCAGNVWFIPYETVKSKDQKFNHPAGFPVDLPRRCILLHGKEQPVVLDPFNGAGTSLVASAQLGATGIGIENTLVYVNATESRLRSLPSNAAVEAQTRRLQGHARRGQDG